MQFSKKRYGVKIFQPFIEPTFFNLFLTLDMNDSLGQQNATITDANLFAGDSGPIRIRKLAPGAPLRKSSALLRLWLTSPAVQVDLRCPEQKNGTSGFH